jgi:hypothetical protein
LCYGMESECGTPEPGTNECVARCERNLPSFFFRQEIKIQRNIEDGLILTIWCHVERPKKKGDRMKRTCLFILCSGFCFCFCNLIPAISIPDTNLSDQDRSDIALLGAHFSSRHIDTISVGRTNYCGHIVIPNPPAASYDFTGQVRFDSIYVDTDRVSYQNLLFYNRHWYAYSAHKPPDSEIVFINDWYSSPSCFYTMEKNVFKIDSLTVVIAQMSGELDKPAVVELLKNLRAIQTNSADTNHSRIPVSLWIHAMTISADTSHDSTSLTIETTCYQHFSYTFFAGELKTVRVSSP